MPGPTEPARLLVLMAKQPIPGRTKTRLSPPLTDHQAVDLYDAFLQDKVAQMKHVPGVNRAVAYTPAEGRGHFSQLASDFALIKQVGKDLSARLANVFEQAFTDGYAQVMAIDGDTPTLPPAYLQRGFAALDDPSTDVVLGPCEDGGYYAIGMTHPHATLFDVTMSTPHVMRDTLARASDAGLTVHTLPEWWDVDRREDLERLTAWLNAGKNEPGFTAPATRRLLSESSLATGWSVAS